MVWDARGWRGLAAGKNAAELCVIAGAMPKGASPRPLVSSASEGGVEQKGKMSLFPRAGRTPRLQLQAQESRPELRWAPELNSVLVPELRGFPSVNKRLFRASGSQEASCLLILGGGPSPTHQGIGADPRGHSGPWPSSPSLFLEVGVGGVEKLYRGGCSMASFKDGLG